MIVAWKARMEPDCRTVDEFVQSVVIEPEANFRSMTAGDGAKVTCVNMSRLRQMVYGHGISKRTLFFFRLLSCMRELIFF
jgi:hypothetical protein